jgi:hypothetical protein
MVNLFDLTDLTGSAGKSPKPVRSEDATNTKVAMILDMDATLALKTISEGILGIIEEDTGSKAISEGLLGTIEEDVGVLSVCGMNATHSDYMATDAEVAI